MKRPRLFAGAGAAAVGSLILIVVVILISCSDAVSHIFVGRQYDPVRDCVGDTTSVDIVSGDNTDLTCALTCFIPELPEAGDLVYVSTECPPFPLFYDTSGKDPRCAKAAAAVARNDFCLDDGGGSTNPIEAGDENTPPAPDSGTSVSDAKAE